jgi:hypothetical protein
MFGFARYRLRLHRLAEPSRNGVCTCAQLDRRESRDQTGYAQHCFRTPHGILLEVHAGFSVIGARSRWRGPEGSHGSLRVAVRELRFVKEAE